MLFKRKVQIDPMTLKRGELLAYRGRRYRCRHTSQPAPNPRFVYVYVRYFGIKDYLVLEWDQTVTVWR